ncbi:MAG: hypothetical protein BroJett040_05540 [Oligoflexia bacterium]|nr:MAG: hypothetical protein BroJett040_05540 [Oligoflexia bacterium]
MKKYILPATALMIATMSTGCLMTRSDVEEHQQKKVMQDQVVTLQKSTADSQSRFNELNSDLREINGRVEALENRIQTSNQDRAKTQQLSDQQLAETNKKVLLLQEEMAKLQTQVEQLGAEIHSLKSDSTTSVKDSSGKSGYEQGEDMFNKKDWKKAIFHYSKFRDKNPKSPKYADATYKIGVSFQELGMKDEAKTFYEEVITKFPQSASAKNAKIRLKKVK